MRQESSANKKKNERLWRFGLIILAAKAAASLLAFNAFLPRHARVRARLNDKSILAVLSQKTSIADGRIQSSFSAD